METRFRIIICLLFLVALPAQAQNKRPQEPLVLDVRPEGQLIGRLDAQALKFNNSLREFLGPLTVKKSQPNVDSAGRQSTDISIIVLKQLSEKDKKKMIKHAGIMADVAKQMKTEIEEFREDRMSAGQEFTSVPAVADTLPPLPPLTDEESKIQRIAVDMTRFDMAGDGYTKVLKKYTETKKLDSGALFAYVVIMQEAWNDIRRLLTMNPLPDKT